MPPKTKEEIEKERKKPKLPRITVSLDDFDELIISKLVGFEGQTKSEVIRSIIKKWIGTNSETIQRIYGIRFEDVRREIQLLQDEEQLQEKIEKLPQFFKRINKIEIDRLSSQLDLNSQTLVNLILENGDQLEKKGLNLVIDGEFIIKE
ncbi:MAG: hypothetical protein EAX89_06370 [Candidatus Lokiarchaeota archaeon]|nr:hypothetical protein [Candidatus Lokiarchaeota archaeon]